MHMIIDVYEGKLIWKIAFKGESLEMYLKDILEDEAQVISLCPLSLFIYEDFRRRKIFDEAEHFIVILWLLMINRNYSFYLLILIWFIAVPNSVSYKNRHRNV